MGPLEGIKILDFTVWMQGPIGSQMLGDMGAQVIKVERVDTGDPERGPIENDPFSYKGVHIGFLAFNRNKKSIAIDLKTKKGKEIIYKLIREVDVVLQNFRPGVMDRLGLGYEVLSRYNPQIIYCSASGFGEKGPYKERPGFDLVAQGMGGLMSITGEEDGPPRPVGTWIVDLYGGTLCAYGIVLALFTRERKKIGQKISISLLDSQISMLPEEFALYFNKKEVLQRPPRGSQHSMSTPPNGVYKAKDKYITLLCPSWEKFCRALNIKHLEKNVKFADGHSRWKHWEELRSIIEEIIRRRPSKEWINLFNKLDIPCGPVYTLDEVFSDPQVLENKMFLSYIHPVVGEVEVVGIPVKLERTPGGVRMSAPLLGQHTEEILRKLGCSTKEIAELRKNRVIQQNEYN